MTEMKTAQIVRLDFSPVYQFIPPGATLGSVQAALESKFGLDENAFNSLGNIDEEKRGKPSLMTSQDNVAALVFKRYREPLFPEYFMPTELLWLDHLIRVAVSKRAGKYEYNNRELVWPAIVLKHPRHEVAFGVNWTSDDGINVSPDSEINVSRVGLNGHSSSSGFSSSRDKLRESARRIIGATLWEEVFEPYSEPLRHSLYADLAHNYDNSFGPLPR